MIFEYIYLFINVYLLGSLCFPDASKHVWIITCFASLVLSILSICTIPYIINNNIGNLVQQQFNHAIFSVDFFIAYCITDLLLSLFDSSYKLNILEGYMHHILYITMLFIFKQNNYCNAFWIFLSCEIPTFIKSIGKLFPHLKSPWLFKNAFILFRICIFIIILIQYFTSVDSSLLIYTAPPALIICMLHIKWGVKLFT